MPLLKPGLIGLASKFAKDDDYFDVMRRIADLGYEGVEGAVPPGDPKEGAAKLRDLGLTLLTTSASREQLRDDLDAVLRQAVDLGVTRVSCWWGPAESRDGVLADAEIFDEAGRRLAAEGVRLAYHHHDHELLTSFDDGVAALDLLAANTDPANLGFVVDLAWSAIGGRDPAALVRQLGRRVTSLHVKDAVEPRRGDDRGVPWTTVGTGSVPLLPACRAAAEVGVEWAVVEQDKVRNLDEWQTTQASLLNLREIGVF